MGARAAGLLALREGRYGSAIARFSECLLSNPRDRGARRLLAVALWKAGRFADAAGAFEEYLRAEGPSSQRAISALFGLACCRLEQGDGEGALAAATAFLDLGNARHPAYRDGVEATARAWRLLGKGDAANELLSGEPWPRERILRTSLAILRWPGQPLPEREHDWSEEDLG